MTQNPLFEEELALGARFDQGGALSGPREYEGVDSGAALASGAALVDLAGMRVLVGGGEAAHGFLDACLAGPRLSLGTCAFEPSLLGDGALASIPLAARTGQREFILMDPTPRSEVLLAWLRFVAQIDQDGFQPYRGLSLDVMTDRLHPLALVGPEAQGVLGDYLPQGHHRQYLPQPGQVRNLDLDGHISTVSLGLPLEAPASYLLLVPPAFAPTLWRSFLSFPVVSPVGTQAFLAWQEGLMPSLSHLGDLDRLVLEAGVLEADGLVRPDHDFIGARGLFA